MYKKGIFVATSFAVVTGLVTFFSGTATSKAADIDARKLYMTHCKTCHGTDGKPTDLGIGLEAPASFHFWHPPNSTLFPSPTLFQSQEPPLRKRQISTPGNFI